MGEACSGETPGLKDVPPHPSQSKPGPALLPLLWNGGDSQVTARAGQVS